MSEVRIGSLNRTGFSEADAKGSAARLACRVVRITCPTHKALERRYHGRFIAEPGFRSSISGPKQMISTRENAI